MPLPSLFSFTPSNDYKLISTRNVSPSLYGHNIFGERIRQANRFLQHRRTFYVACGLFACYCSYILSSGVPPSFSDIREYERNLPQHNRGKEEEDGRKFFRVTDPNRGRGFNNVIIESLMMSYISYVSNRTWVFNDYIWANHPLPYTIYENALRPSRIPLNAFISGPTAGGLVPNSSYRAVSIDYYDTICPPTSGRYQLDTKNAPGVDANGVTLVKWWKDELERIPNRCVEARKPVLDLFFFGADRLLSLWPEFCQSPIIQGYSWSFLVYSAFARNLYLFDSIPKSSIDTTATIDSLVAIHIRRGDYDDHCYTLYSQRTPYMGINSFPELPDRFEPPVDKDKLLKYYLARCLPTTEEVVHRLQSLRKDNPGLKKVYVLTNAGKGWVRQLSDELVHDGWNDVKSTYDLHLDPQQYWVSHGVDSLIAEKADVFVGNGFSSLTANIIMFRLARGIEASRNRFL